MSSLFPEFLSRSPRAVYERQVWGEFFGDLIRSAREERTLSVEETSRAAICPPFRGLPLISCTNSVQWAGATGKI